MAFDLSKKAISNNIASITTIALKEQATHVRLSESHNLMAAVGVAAGCLYLLTLLAGIILAPLQRHSFYFQAFEQLYLARSESTELFSRKAQDVA